MSQGPLLSVIPLVLAYLDPGTGSQLLQLAIASLLAGLFTLKLYWRRFRAFLSGVGKPAVAPSPVQKRDGADPE